MADKSNQSLPDVVHMVLEDTLEAVRTRMPIMPRIARLMAALEKDVVVKDAKAFIFMSRNAPGGTIREEPEEDRPAGA